jgi:hypothetical protein
VDGGFEAGGLGAEDAGGLGFACRGWRRRRRAPALESGALLFERGQLALGGAELVAQACGGGGVGLLEYPAAQRVDAAPLLGILVRGWLAAQNRYSWIGSFLRYAAGVGAPDRPKRW